MRNLFRATVAVIAGMTAGIPFSVVAEGANDKSALSAIVRSVQSGPWSSSATWEGGKLPGAGARVLICEGHRIVYDLHSDQAIRGINVAGVLSFATDKDTRLDVGLIKIQASAEYSEEGFECEAHLAAVDPTKPRPALEVGTPETPVPAKFKALIRLVYFDGMNKDSCPAIVCCGGRWDMHGAPLSRTWVKLGTTAMKGDNSVAIAEDVNGWKVGDRVIVPPTGYHGFDLSTTEERFVQAIDGTKITFNQPLEYTHLGESPYRGEVANLSRNVVVESADPKGIRGHTMYHRDSAGAISYVEFRHLGKQGMLGRYALHYHLVGDTMRGSYITGASIWDSHNRWLTIHGTNYLVVCDNVGWGSVGHGYFFEDGTEVYNVMDRNLAVGARRGKPLPKQVLRFDPNTGAGYWWANSLNTFTRNVAADNGEYGFRFEASASKEFPLEFDVQQPDGSKKRVDIRTLPFVRFDDNESHSNNGPYGFWLGNSLVGPDARHPFIIRNLLIWNTHYGFRPGVPSVLVENMKLLGTIYGVYHPNYDNHVYRNITINGDGSEPFNRGHDDNSVQYGRLTVDGLTFVNLRPSGDGTLIQMSDDNPTGKAVSHFRNVKVVRDTGARRTLINTGGGKHVTPKTEQGVPIYIHDHYGPNRHAKIMATNANDFGKDNLKYREEPLLTGQQSRVTEVSDVEFPKLLDPVDDLPPTTVITHVRKQASGKLLVRGTTADNGTVSKVTVNGVLAKAVAANYAEWEVNLPADSASRVAAFAEDAAGNIEPRPHAVSLK